MPAEELLRAINKDRRCDLPLARQIAQRIRDPDYNLQQFHDDLVAAFPEMDYYMIADATISSGGSPKDEYLRTIGAAFAVYWLMRIGIDGERGFCFGVDEEWQPNTAPAGYPVPAGSFFGLDPSQRRLAFYYKAVRYARQLPRGDDCYVDCVGGSSGGGRRLFAARGCESCLPGLLCHLLLPHCPLTAL